MIGVMANASDCAVIREFFELFKTPWEFYQTGRPYDVLLCAGDVELPEHRASLVVIYGGQKLSFEAADTLASHHKDARVLSYKGTRIPIYGSSVTFREKETGVLVDEISKESSIRVEQSKGSVLARIGYDLFDEIRTLLTVGQPRERAGIPTLELHIAILRELIVASGVALVEIPPVPEGYGFIACLTHDVDHPSIRMHKFDHTMLGFLYRAMFGSLINVLRGRRPARDLLTNWIAALKLPLVHLGLAKDYWHDFDRYSRLEQGARSSFFVIPFKDHPGRSRQGLAPKHRAARYGAADLAGAIQRLMSTGCEVGLHGIDAWLDSSQGRGELEEIRRITGRQDIGVRMHWLYFDEQSPETLERAGADYDSTIGYNEIVGYRAGTHQVYKPLGATRLLELPLHVMDTALFYPGYLGLSATEAKKPVSAIIDNAAQLGGCVTVNWHDRSIAPERLWGEFYVDVLGELKSKGAWFATASQAVSWFRKRRSAVFETVSAEQGSLRVKVAVDAGDELPGLQLRVHQPREAIQGSPRGERSSERTRDIRLKHSGDTCVTLSQMTGIAG